MHLKLGATVVASSIAATGLNQSSDSRTMQAAAETYQELASFFPSSGQEEAANPLPVDGPTDFRIEGRPEETRDLNCTRSAFAAKANAQVDEATTNAVKDAIKAECREKADEIINAMDQEHPIAALAAIRTALYIAAEFEKSPEVWQESGPKGETHAKIRVNKYGKSVQVDPRKYINPPKGITFRPPTQNTKPQRAKTGRRGRQAHTQTNFR